MKKFQLLLLSSAAVVLTSCSGKLGALSSDNFTVTPNPLETQAGKVPATITGSFPANYMKKKAVVQVIPELRFNGQSAVGQGATFQGESVLGNDQTINYKMGGVYDMKTSFNYQPEMQESELYLTFNARVGKKTVKIPDVKVATGVLATSELYKRTLTSANAALSPDAFQRIVKQEQEANIKFLIGQANLRKSELQNNSVQEFVRLLQDIAAKQETLRLDNVEVTGFASPDGGFDINDRLASNRRAVAQKYVDQQMQKTGANGSIDTKYTAEDWDGFKQLVQASNIQDKDVILRVLSMYQDPEEREAQIRNISSAFRELADGILPQLRRSRLIANYEVIGRSDDQIKDQLQRDARQLSIEELLYAGGQLYADNADKAKEAYQKATQVYPNDARAYNNLARLAYAKGNYAEAKQMVEKALSIDRNQPEANANQGMLALINGDLSTAESLIAKATGANGYNEVLGNLHLAQGKYAQAAQDLSGVASNSAALAQILNKNYQEAINTLSSIKNGDGITDYLMAIAYKRINNGSQANTYLQKAIEKDPTLASYAAKDLEFK
ncbi:MAG: tetratricopeptide repeat protein [Prevotella sp.]|nr:tetratricopeptide repeat protein [Prevotella sp.]MBR6189414.1 tetratricopeptide repeat protein [Prevotella sp.]